MSQVKIKICGLTRPCDVDMVNAARPDYAGFVFAKSRRQVTLEKVSELTSRLASGILSVGVFVDEKIEKITDIIKTGARLDLIQLHGTENEDYIVNLKAITGKPVIKAVSIKSKGDAERWVTCTADYLLLDSQGGGTGRRFDWGLIGEIPKPFFLAGGLTFENVTDALVKVKPYAVDVSSGVETDGFKDETKITDFIKSARSAEAYLT